MQSCPELSSEAVDYFQQDMNGQPVTQTAETLTLVIDNTAAAQDLQAVKHLLIEVCKIFCNRPAFSCYAFISCVISRAVYAVLKV